MKSLFFILLAGYAVRSYENNYYVIQMSDNPPIQTKKPFKVYWNVPTMQCSSKKVYFENLYEDYGIIQNDNDRFKGEKITILYDPGLFPALFKNETSGKFRFRNGGVPQEGNLGKHLDAFEKDLDHSIPDKDFSGVGIIDFESWRPVFRQNFGVLQPYKDISFEIERKLHWWWKKAWIEDEAKRRFEEAARTYMQTTLSVAKKLRPLAQWGFYGFPYCFNMASNNMVERCAKNVPEENDQIPWLWSGSTALYPSVYSSVQLSTAQLESLVRGRIREASRCARASRSKPDILPYFWFRYRDAGFLTETDLTKALSTLYKSDASGILIWGSSNDVNTVDKCNKLLKYLKTTLGPAIAKYTKQTNKLNLMYVIDNSTDVSNISTTTDNPLYNDYTNSDINIDLDPEYHWDPPENYSQQIKHNVEEEINKKLSQEVIRIGDDKDRPPVLQNDNVLIDFILNTVLRTVEDDNLTSTVTPKTKNDKKTLLENEDLLNTTKVSSISNTNTSQVTNSVVTNNPLRSENNDDIYSQDDLKTNGTRNEDILPPDEITTTERITEQAVTADINSFYPSIEIEFDISATDATMTDTIEASDTTESEIFAILDSEVNNFFNIDTFNNHHSVKTPIQTETNHYERNLAKSEKKEIQASTDKFMDQNLEKGATNKITDKTKFEDLSTEFTFIDSTTNSFTEHFKTTETNEEILKTTSSVDTTQYMEQTDTIANETESSTLIQNSEDIESSSDANEFAKTDDLGSNDSLRTTPVINNSSLLEGSKSIKANDVTKIMEGATTENASKTTVREESSAPTKPTTTKQVAV